MAFGSTIADVLRKRGLVATVAVLASAVGFLTPALIVSSAVAKPHHHHRRHARRHRRHKARASRTCADATTPVGRVSRQATKTAVVCLINKQRAAHGLPILREADLLDRSAQGWTDTMVATGSFTHGADFAARISAVGFRWNTAGENIATGFITPRAVVNAWMASTGHCENILNPTFTNVGTGVVDKVVGGFGSLGATWTQDFALAAGHRPPSGNKGPMDGCPY